MASIGYQGVAASGIFTQQGYLAAVGGGVPTAAQAATAAYMPYIGFGIGIAAALIDTFVLMPALRGKGQKVAEPPKLVDVPTGSNEAGAPRIWALGARVRVPTHVLWQQAKQRENTSGSNKAGTAVQLRKVYFDAAIALNDRPVRELSQLSGNGKLILFKTRNIVGVTTSAMTLSIVSGRVRLTMSSTLDPDFNDVFSVGDAAELRGWVQTSGTDINTDFWKVDSIKQITTTPSYIELVPYSGQTVAGIVATAGTPFDPAVVRRVDDHVFCEAGIRRDAAVYSPASTAVIYFKATGTNWAIKNIFTTADRLRVVMPTAPTFNADVKLLVPDAGANLAWFWYDPPQSSYTSFIQVLAASATNPPYFTYRTPSIFSSGVFAPTFNPENFFYTGSETQTASALIEADEGAGNVPAYRGLAYQVFDDFYATLFGDQLPYSMEALIACDRTMDWPQAFRTILCERYGLPQGAVDATGLTVRPFLGYYIRGPLPGVTALQPLLLAGQIMTQDRDGTLVFNEFQNADEVAIENGAVFSDFGTRLDGESASDDKWRIEDAAVEDLPTKIGVRHQDPDNIYASGYQFFGLRNPEGVDHTNEQELDLSQLVMTRREAANLAATVLRRSWVNRRTYRFVLPAAYIDLLESDLLTWTDDEGVDHVARIIQRDIGSDFRVGITAIAEDLDLAVAGSPVQSAAGSVPQLPSAPAGLDVVIVDGPAYIQGQNSRPGLHIAIGTYGGNWSGAAIYESVDGTTYDLIDVVGKRATTGTLDTALGSGQVAEFVGMTGLGPDAGSCTVTLTSYGANQMTSRTAKEVYAGANWCALVKPDGTVEIAAFTSVTALGDNQFTLSGWLRGLRGTGNPYSLTVSEAPAGTRFVLLNGETYFREFAGDITPTALSYKIVPAGLGLEDVEQINVVSARRNALPLPVRTLTKTIDPTTFDARLTVTHNWSRAVLPLGTQPPHPMDEPLEAYRFTIYDPAGSQVRRIKTITASGTGSNTIRDRWIDYPASEQSADGYTPGASTIIAVDVQQIGEFGLGPSVLRKF
jgi:hypothetical protein